MPEGQKFDSIPSSAGWLHICALMYCARALTDGFVSRERAYKLTNDSPQVVTAAIGWLGRARRAGLKPLWETVEGGWNVHDYTDPQYGNPTRAGAEAIRSARSEAGVRGGRRSAETRAERYGSAQPGKGGTPNSNAEANAEANASEAPEAPFPTLPYIPNGMSVPRPDVDRLCERLAEMLERLGVRQRTVTETWRHEARLMLDRDGRPLDEALELMGWALTDGFWQRNIHSLPKFREKYDRLLMDRRAEGRPHVKAGSVDDRAQKLLTGQGPI